MKKHKNEEHSRLLKLIMEAAMFLKMQNFFAFESLIILTAAKRKKCKRNFTKNPYFLCVSYVNRQFKDSFEVSI